MKILFPIVMCVCSFASTANNLVSKQHWNKTVRQQVTTTQEVLSNLKNFTLSESDRLSLKKTKEDNVGFTHLTYVQLHNNIPVENSTILIHEKGGAVELVNGNTAHHFDGNTTPSINEATALKAALNFVNAKQYAWEILEFEETLCKSTNNQKSTFYPTGELLWYKSIDNDETPYKLYYKFDIYSIEPNTRQNIYINAQTGLVTESISRMANCTSALVTAETNYNNTVNFHVCKNGNQYHLKNTETTYIEVFDAGQSHLIYQNEILDTDNYFEKNKAANEVFYASQKVHNYFKNNFGRNSIDNSGMPILSWVNYANEFGNRNNAFWNGNWMLYGSGDGEKFNSLTSIDIVAHEMMHGITEFAANLVYKNESGALNESFSDIFGEVIELYTKGSVDWLVGADVVIISNKTALRSLINPNDGTTIYRQPDTYKGTNWWTAKEDYGGVHYNSGVQNHWFYLLAEGGSGINDNSYSYIIEPIGIDKAAAIAYRNLAYYLTPNAVYEDAKNGSIQAAIDLYGVDSFEAQQTELAWQAVGIGEQVNQQSACRIADSINLNILSDYIFEPGWDKSKPIDQWPGIWLNEDGCIVSIAISENTDGTLPPEIGNFKQLETLSIFESDLTGPIPPEIGQLINLTHLDLGESDFTGAIPPQIGNLVNLTYLDIGENDLVGQVPMSFKNLVNLIDLDITGRNLTGTLNEQLSNCRNLIQLRIGGGKFEGNIEFINDMPFLKNASIIFNNFSGNLDRITNYNLDFLDLRGNKFDGELPLKLLSNFNARVQMTHNNFSGCYPEAAKPLCSKYNKHLISQGNNFDVDFDTFCNTGAGTCIETINCRTQDSLTLLKVIPNFETQIDVSGSMDTWRGVTLNENGCVKEIDWDDCCVRGGILAPEIWNLSSLEKLYITESGVGGTIPPEIGNLSNLVELGLWQNNLSGSLPIEMGNLANLVKLDIGVNSFTGTIPLEIGNLSNLEIFAIGNNNLTGGFPKEFSNLNNLNLLQLSSNNLSGCYDALLSVLCNNLQYSYITNGNNFDATWTDFCNTGAGICDAVAVWPGDMDNNGIVNANDLLYYGLAFGNTGTARANATTLWQPQQATLWDDIVAGKNGVYQDANGDGVVDFADFSAIEQNFGKSHQVNNIANNVSPVSLQLELESSTKYGEEVELKYNLYAKYGDGIAPNIYGLSGSINFSNLPVKEISTDFSQSSLQPTEHLLFFDNSTGVLDISLTRTNKMNIKAEKPVAIIIIVIDDVPTGDPYSIGINNGSFTTVSGGLNGTISSGFYDNFNINQGIGTSLTVTLNTTNALCDTFGSAMASIKNGVAPYNIQWSGGSTGLNNHNLEAGAYTVYVTDAIGNTAQLQFIIYANPPVYDQNGTVICGTDCPDYLLPNESSGNNIFQSAKIIDANCSFAGDKFIQFKAGEAITLDKGFYIAPKVDFSAVIEACE